MIKTTAAVMLDKTVDALRRKAYEKGLRDGARKLFTKAEREALRAAGQEAMAGMFQGDIKALERAMEKL